MRGSALARFAAHPIAAAALLVLAASSGCAARARNEARGGPMTKMGSDRYLQKAIRSSNEGVILLPSLKAERVYELPRLNEIAHALREPAAKCFLLRAIDTMEPTSDERGFAKVPEGQVKLRVRIAPSGEVLRTEVLESGFTDAHMPECVGKAVAKQMFPPNKGGVSHYIDVVYWVSLGLQADVHTEAYRQQVRREQVAAGVRARPCLQGRAPAGHHRIGALNLVDRYGNTMVNRVDAPSLPDDVRSCVSQALRELRMAPQSDAFVRPVLAQIEVDVGPGGEVAVRDEQWLHLLELEEQAQRAALRAAARGDDDGATDDGPVIDVDRPVEDGVDEPPDATPDDATPDETTPDGAPPRPTPGGPRRDPGQGGIKIDLGPRRAP